MTVQQAFEEFLNSSTYANRSKQRDSEGSKYRVMKLRYNRDELDYLAMINLLVKEGYTVSVQPPKKSK